MKSNRLIVLQFDKGLIDKITYNQSLSLLKEKGKCLIKSRYDIPDRPY
ncbi:MAG: hypothetical protein WD426_06550 [Anditalea sp.]